MKQRSQITIDYRTWWNSDQTIVEEWRGCGGKVEGIFLRKAVKVHKHTNTEILKSVMTDVTQ